MSAKTIECVPIVSPAPSGRLLAEDIERARRNADMKREIFTGPDLV
jgi:hypothetical protein